MVNLTFPIVPEPLEVADKIELQFPIFGVIPVTNKPKKVKVEEDNDRSDSV